MNGMRVMARVGAVAAAGLLLAAQAQAQSAPSPTTRVSRPALIGSVRRRSGPACAGRLAMRQEHRSSSSAKARRGKPGR